MMLSAARNIRVSQRPLLMAITETDEAISDMRKAGADLGFKYPVEPKTKIVCGPKGVENTLEYEPDSAVPDVMLGEPEGLIDILKDCQIPADEALRIKNNEIANRNKYDEHYAKFCHKVVKLYDVAAHNLFQVKGYHNMYFR